MVDGEEEQMSKVRKAAHTHVNVVVQNVPTHVHNYDSQVWLKLS